MVQNGLIEIRQHCVKSCCSVVRNSSVLVSNIPKCPQHFQRTSHSGAHPDMRSTVALVLTQRYGIPDPSVTIILTTMQNQGFVATTIWVLISLARFIRDCLQSAISCSHAEVSRFKGLTQINAASCKDQFFVGVQFLSLGLQDFIWETHFLNRRHLHVHVQTCVLNGCTGLKLRFVKIHTVLQMRHFAIGCCVCLAFAHFRSIIMPFPIVSQAPWLLGSETEASGCCRTSVNEKT